MKKLHGIFLYCMLASAPIYSISLAESILSALFGIVATKGYELAHMHFSTVEVIALNSVKNKVVGGLSTFIVYIDYFGGDKCGLWKSNARLKKEEENRQATIANQNREEALRLEKEREVFELKQECAKKIDAILIDNQKKIDELNKLLLQAQNNESIQREIARCKMEYDTIINKMAEENKQLTQKILAIQKCAEIENLKKENSDLKFKLDQRSMFTNINNSFTLTTKPTPSICPHCNAPLLKQICEMNNE